MERCPLEILTTMVIESLPETTSAYLTLVSPRKPNVHPIDNKMRFIYVFHDIFIEFL
jgi:hypothetical protein